MGRPQREPFLERHHFLTFVALALFGLGLTTLSIRQPERFKGVQEVGLTVMGPMARAGSSVSGAAGEAWGGVRSTWKAREDLAVLAEEVASLRPVVAERDELAFENARLRDLLDFRERIRPKTVAARVLFQERGPDWVLVIDKGSDDGVAEDQAVIAATGVVGKVLSVSRGVARVQCVLDGDAGVAVRVGPQGRQAEAIMADGAGATCRLRHVDLLEDVQPGDAVVTSGKDTIYPSGLLVGVVEFVEAPGLDRDILVRPAVDFSSLDNVLVVVSADKAMEDARKERTSRDPAAKRNGS
jgi:rod shape-determining protein MreC